MPPLSSPSGADGGEGVARSNLLLRLEIESSGADLAVNFTACVFDSALNVGVIGGNNSFIGFIADFRQGKLIESVALPSTVIPGGQITDLQRNEINNGIIALINGEAAQTADGGATWTAIASVFTAFATSSTDMVAWKGAQIISGNSKQTIPERNYSVSNDNGASWAGQFFSGGTPGASPLKIRKSPGDVKIYFVGQNANLATSTTADLTDDTGWTLFDFGALFGAGTNGVDVAFNADGTKAIYITDLGNVIVSVDSGVTWASFPTALNYFKQGAAGFFVLEWIVFVPEMDGFLLGSTSRAAFIPAGGNLQTMTAVSIATNAAVGVIEDACSMVNGIGVDALIPASTNAAFITPRAA